MSVPPPLPPKNRTASSQTSNVTPSPAQPQPNHSHDDFFNPAFTASGVNSTTQYSSAPPPLPPKNKTVSPPATSSHTANHPSTTNTNRNTPPSTKPIPQASVENVVASDVFDSPFEDPFEYQRRQPQVAQLPTKPTSSAYNPPIYTPPSQLTYNPSPQPSSSINPPLPAKKPPQNTNVFLDNQQGSGPSLNFNTTTSVKASTVLSATQPYQSPQFQTASNYIPSSMLDKSVPVDVKMNMSLSNPDTVNVNVNGVNAKVPTKTMLKVASTAASVGVASYQQSNKKQ